MLSPGSVRVELNCRTPCWCPRIPWCCETPAPSWHTLELGPEPLGSLLRWLLLLSAFGSILEGNLFSVQGMLFSFSVPRRTKAFFHLFSSAKWKDWCFHKELLCLGPPASANGISAHHWLFTEQVWQNLSCLHLQGKGNWKGSFFLFYLIIKGLKDFEQPSMTSVHTCCCLVAKSCATLLWPHGPHGSSVHGISQARRLEWVAISFSRGSSQPRDWTCISCIGRWILHHRVTGEPVHTQTTMIHLLISVWSPSLFAFCV